MAKGMDQAEEAMIQLIGTDQGGLYAACSGFRNRLLGGQYPIIFIVLKTQSCVGKIPHVHWAERMGRLCLPSQRQQGLGFNGSADAKDTQGLIKGLEGMYGCHMRSQELDFFQLWF